MWRFPSDLLTNESFCLQVSLFNPKNPISSWEEIKAKVQSQSHTHTKFQQKQAKIELNSLKNTLCYVNKRLYEGDNLNND